MSISSSQQQYFTERRCSNCRIILPFDDRQVLYGANGQGIDLIPSVSYQIQTGTVVRYIITIVSDQLDSQIIKGSRMRKIYNN